MVAGLAAMRFEPANVALLLLLTTFLVSVAERFKAGFFAWSDRVLAFEVAFLGAGLAVLPTVVADFLTGLVDLLSEPAFFLITYVLAFLRGDLDKDLALV